MRHRKAGLKLNRTSSHRKAMFRNMVTSLIKYDQIRTTDAKAKELRRWGDKMVTLAKRGDLHARRLALSIIRERAVVKKLFDEAPERFGAVSGGYTRVVKLGRRPGDAATMSMVAFITPDDTSKKKKKKKTEKAATPAPVVATAKDKSADVVDDSIQDAEESVSTLEESGAETSPAQEDINEKDASNDLIADVDPAVAETDSQKVESLPTDTVKDETENEEKPS